MTLDECDGPPVDCPTCNGTGRMMFVFSVRYFDVIGPEILYAQCWDCVPGALAREEVEAKARALTGGVAQLDYIGPPGPVGLTLQRIC